MGKALYRTYRSTSFDEVIGQEHVTTTLKNALKNDTINHAYLLTGPKGVGKTSVARILAHAVNGLQYVSDDNLPIDIIEIDAASNRRIDEVRELRENARTVPTAAKYKVYIIDEVHMLTREAFNALLKTLEEPPAHVIFILATTESHKLPDTIISRCLRFNFKPISQADITAQLRKIADKEGLDIDGQALELLARHGDGSFRDSISALDQIRSIGRSVKLEDVEGMLGIPPEAKIEKLMDGVYSGQPNQLVEELSAIYALGTSPSELARQLGQQVRSGLLNHSLKLPDAAALQLMGELLDIAGAPKPKAQLELALLGVLLQQNPTEKSPVEEPAVATVEKKEPTEVIDDQPEISDNPWTEVLAALKAKNNTLYSVTRMAEPYFEQTKLTLRFDFAFHHKQVSEANNKAIIMGLVQNFYPHITELELRVAAKPPMPAPGDSAVTSISNIFGPSEVLE